MRTPIKLYLQVNASSKKTVSSRRITYPFRIRHVRLNFPIGNELNLPVWIIVSKDDTIPTTAVPDGINIAQILGGEAEIKGNAEVIEMETDIVFKERGQYIKVFGENKDAVNGHYVNVIIEIESLINARTIK